MSRNTSEALQRLGDRLDWIFPPEREEALLDLIAPLFGEPVAPSEPATSLSPNGEGRHAGEGTR